MCSKQKSDKQTTRFLIPCKKEGMSAAEVVDIYLKQVKEDLGIYTGRLLWTGNGINFTKIPMGKNMIGKVPSDMAERMNLQNASGFTFHLFRRSAATAVEDVGATSEHMCDFFWLGKR